MKIIISNSAGVPIYEQIEEQIKAAIFSGQLKEGDLLPSIRQLARDLHISVITTTRVYSELEQSGFVDNVQGKGCYVKSSNSQLIREQLLREVEQNLSAAISSARTAGITKEDLITMLELLSKEDDYA